MRNTKLNLFIIIVFTIMLLFYIINLVSMPEHFIIKSINNSLNINVPHGDIKYYENNMNGFHGDGEIVLIISLTKEENELFYQNIDYKWENLNCKSDIYNLLWCSDTIPGKKAHGGLLNEKLYPERDTVFILWDSINQKTNESIELTDLYNFYYVGYSFEKSSIFIQMTNI